ncbi:tyrosine-type recombinase/integrase [Rhizobium leucaenae]|uniref:tyrosine-type recombinase/integrase n=1 Tax=Rhizobium leucaenae TaxID=29450 RepID=UPI001621AAFE|nr:site-specific integrase [Rhizobium leucaenae]MBB6299425.1 integrase [Rhizobium leucaenae]
MALIKKRKWTNASGTHEAYRLDFTDRHGKRHREQFPKKRDAETRLGELQAETGKGTYRPLADKSTVSAACTLFLKYMSDRHDRGEKVTATYLNTSKQHCQNYIDPDGEHVDEKRRGKIDFEGGIGSIKLTDLTPRRVIQFRDDMRKHGAGIVTTRRVLGTLSRILKHAVENDLAVINVAKGIRVIGTRNEDGEKIVPPSKKVLADLLKKASPDFKVRVQFAATSGLRASEQWALKWSNVDLKVGTVIVDSRVDAYGGIDTTKSGAGRRTVPLGKTTVEALKAWRERSNHKGDDDFVFPDSGGNFTRHTNMTKRQWIPLLTAAEVEPIGWHSLRHFAVSTWIEAGLQPKAVQTLAGHATYAITMDRYGHLFPTDDHKEAFDRISETLG